MNRTIGMEAKARAQAGGRVKWLNSEGANGSPVPALNGSKRFPIPPQFCIRYTVVVQVPLIKINKAIGAVAFCAVL